MSVLFLSIFFILGTIIGSFLNVVVLRYNTGLSFVSGRSQCFSCSKKLSWYENIPLFSFIFLGGRCLGCKSKISYQYPLVEFLTGTLFLGVFYEIGFSVLLPLYLIIASLLIVMSVYDLKHKIIPNSFVFLFDGLAFILLLSTHSFSSLFSGSGFYDFFAGPILFSFFGTLWLVSRGTWMGFGDAKLALGVGWMLGFSGGIFAIISAFWIGAIWSIIILALQKLNLSKLRLGMKSEIPFAPFIIIALYLQFFTHWDFATILHAFTW